MTSDHSMKHQPNRSLFFHCHWSHAVIAALALVLAGCEAVAPPGTPDQKATQAFLEDNYLRVGELKTSTSDRTMFVKPGRYELSFVTMDVDNSIETWTGNFDLKAGHSYGRMNSLMDADGRHRIPELREILTPASAWDIGKQQQFKILGRFHKLAPSGPKP